MFQNARLKLTAWYLLIIMLVSIGFSAVIYRALTLELNRFSHLQRLRTERRIFIDPDLVEETRRRLILFLSIINAGILFIAGGLSYFLAGRTLAPIKDMIDEQNRFISDASHELRTPLTALKSAIEVNLRDKNLTMREAKKLISENIEEVNKLQTLSEELLTLAQYEKPDGHSKFEKLVLSELIEKVVDKIEPLAKQKNIMIYNKTQKITVKGNKYGLSGLFTILLDNAIKYSKEKTSIIISSKKTDGFVAVSFKDEGIGIAEKDIPHIFDRFYRADTARSKQKVGGYGLGLAIAKKIVEVHRGSITFESKINKGSTFTVRLPVFS